MSEEKDISRRDEFPSNSMRSRERQKDDTIPKIEGKTKRVEKITQGKVIRQKKGIGKKLKEAFIPDDTKSVGEFILYDVVIFKLKSMICDMVGWDGAAEMILFGEKGARRNRRDPLGRSRPSYSSYYTSTSDRDRDRVGTRRDSDKRDISGSARARHDFDEIVLESRGEAEDVLSHLIDLIDQYGMAAVSDLYDLVDIPTNFTDNKYGWTNLKSAYVSRVKEGYIINLPKTVEID